MIRAWYAALMLIPSLTLAQSASMPIDLLERGTEVRVWTRDSLLSGWKLRYLGRTDTSLLLAERSGSRRIEGFRGEIASSQIDRVEVRTGTTYVPGRAGRMFLRGIGVGAVTGALSGMILSEAACTVPNCETEMTMIGLGVLGGIAGGVIGGAIGSHSVTVWTQVRIR